MKTHVFKIFGCIMLTVSLAVSFFAVPVAAATGWNKVESDCLSIALGVTNRPGEIIQGVENNSSYDFAIPSAFNGTLVVAARFVEASFSVVPGNVVVVDPFYSGGWLGGSNNKIIGYCWSVFDYSDNEWSTTLLGTSDMYEVNYTGGKGYTIDLPATEVKINYGSDNAVVALEIFMERSSAANFSMNNATVTFGYGSPSSPDYPSYVAPDDGNMGALEDTEDQLLQGSEQGLNNATETFTNFGSTIMQFEQGMVLISQMMTRLTGNIPLVGAIVTISMSLGIFASLLGLAGAIVSAADRKASAEARRSK